MKKNKSRKASNKTKSEKKESLYNQRKFDFLWLLASQPKKTFSSEDILNEIMDAGLMIHEKQFFEIMTQNFCRKTGVQFLQKKKVVNSPFKNKFMTDDFNFF